MMTMMESTTTIDLTETAPPQATSIEEIHIETIEERLHICHLPFSILFTIFRFECTTDCVIKVVFAVCVSAQVCVFQSFLFQSHIKITVNYISKRSLGIMCMIKQF